jgi:CheY-like chemotaxis protein
MSNPHKIVLIGFNSFERATFESFFRLAARRPPGYTLVTDPSEANLAVVNADDPATLSTAKAKKPCPHVMLIGSSDGGTGWITQSRPLNLMKVLTNVELLLKPVVVAAAAPIFAPAPAPAPMMAPTQTATAQPIAKPVAVPVVTPKAVPEAKSIPTSPLAAKPLAPVVPTVPAKAPAITPALENFTATQPFVSSSRTPLAAAMVESAIAPPAMRVPPPKAAPPATASKVAERSTVRTGSGDFAHSQTGSPVLGSVTRPTSIEDEANLDHILVVDDSDIALKFMRNRLTRFGFRTDLVNSGEEALGRMNTRPYKFVFLDVMMEGMDGYQTCRAIKQRKYSEGKPPVVVMLTSRGGTIDKIRGTLAGCDAYLTKPLNERDLIAVLAKHDRTVARGFQATNFGASAKSGFGSANSR